MCCRKPSPTWQYGDTVRAGRLCLLGGLYLVVVPLALYFWMNKRWHRMGKVERLGIYGMVFLFFPG